MGEHVVGEVPIHVRLNGCEQRAAQQQDLNEVVEVSCLKACVLAVVGKGEELLGPFIEIGADEML